MTTHIPFLPFNIMRKYLQAVDRYSQKIRMIIIINKKFVNTGLSWFTDGSPGPRGIGKITPVGLDLLLVDL